MIATTRVTAMLFLLGAASPTASPTVMQADLGEVAWVVPDSEGIVEGLAYHPATHGLYVSDVRNRCIWFRDTTASSAAMKKFSSDTDGLFGVFALKIDAAGKTLWASSSAIPQMNGYTAADQGQAFLAVYDLPTGTLRRAHRVPADGRAHLLGDFALASDGTVYLTDSSTPIIWRLPPGGTGLEKWVEHADFKSLQGVALGNDQRSLYVADYATGLWRIDILTRAASLLPAPAGTELRGIDGIYPITGGLVAVQNGTKTQRILRIALDQSGAPAEVGTLLSGHPAMTDLALGQVIDGQLHFVANAGWEIYAKPATPPPPRQITILRTKTD